MAKETRQVGVIVRFGPMFQARPSKQSGAAFDTVGEARDYFRRWAGQETVLQASQAPVQSRNISFTGDIEATGQETVWLTANW